MKNGYVMDYNCNIPGVEFSGEKRFLSNMFPCNIKFTDEGMSRFLKEKFSCFEFNNKVFQSSENLYQYLKTDNEEHKEFIRLSSPGNSKKISKIIDIRADWEEIKVLSMELCVFLKFTQNFYLEKMLLETRDEILIERNTWGDTFWGVSNGSGKNYLGVILMNTRKYFNERRKMILTSNFANWRKQSISGRTLCSIARYPPNSFKGETESRLFPSRELLFGFKSGKILEKEYTEIYNKQLDLLDPEELYDELSEKILLCYEKFGDFCHRNLVNKWLRKHGFIANEFGNISVGVIGSRTFNNRELGISFLEKIDKKYGIGEIVSGGATGADIIGEIYASKHDKKTEIFIPDWDTYGKSAGFKRNYEIVDKSDIIVAFWDGKSKGTKHSIDLTRAENKSLFLYNYETNKITKEIR